MAIGALWVVGAGLLIASIEFFDPNNPSSSLDTSPDDDDGATREHHQSSSRSHINHHLVSLMISLSSCVLYVVADIAIFHFGFDESWMRPVLICAWVAAVAAVPLTVLVSVMDAFSWWHAPSCGQLLITYRTIHWRSQL